MSDPLGISPDHLIITLPTKNTKIVYNADMTLKELLERCAEDGVDPAGLHLCYENEDGETVRIYDFAIDGNDLLMVGD